MESNMASMENNMESPENTTEKEPTTRELVAEIETDKELSEFANGVRMMQDYADIGVMEFFGDITEKDMKKLAKEEEIRVEPIPEQLRNGEAEFKVYKITKEFSPNSKEEQKIVQDESERNEILEKDAVVRYESLVTEGKLKPLDLSHEEIANYKKDNNIPNENIKSAACLDEDGNLIEGISCYYKLLD